MREGNSGGNNGGGNEREKEREREREREREKSGGKLGEGKTVVIERLGNNRRLWTFRIWGAGLREGKKGGN